MCVYFSGRICLGNNWRMGESDMLGYVVEVLDAMPLIDGFGLGCVDNLSWGLYYSVVACVCV